jgi:hypothetical protein
VRPRGTSWSWLLHARNGRNGTASSGGICQKKLRKQGMTWKKRVVMGDAWRAKRGPVSGSHATLASVAACIRARAGRSPLPLPQGENKCCQLLHPRMHVHPPCRDSRSWDSLDLHPHFLSPDPVAQLLAALHTVYPCSDRRSFTAGLVSTSTAAFLVALSRASGCHDVLRCL